MLEKLGTAKRDKPAHKSNCIIDVIELTKELLNY